MKGPGSRSAAPRSERPQLQGPGVLRRRYVRHSPSPVVEAPPSPSTPGEAPAPTEVSSPRGIWASSSLVPGFIALQLVCQLALLVEALAPLRVVFRILTFGVSLALIALVPGRLLRHPALPFVLAA